MKRFATFLLTLLLLLLPVCAYASEVVDYTADFYVADYANVLSDEVEGLVVLNNDKLDKACGAQIVVVMVDTVGSSTIENYAYTLFNKWGIGSKDKNNGLLILVAVNDGQYWLMPGKGLQDYLTAGDLDEMASQHFIPSAQSGNFDEAIRQLFNACFNHVSIAYNAGLAADETLYQSYLQSGASGTNGAVYLSEPLKDMPSALSVAPTLPAQNQQETQPSVNTPPASPAAPQRAKNEGSILPFFIIVIVVLVVIGLINTNRTRPGRGRPAPHKPAPRPAPRPVSHPPINRVPRSPVSPSRPMGGTPRPPVSPSRPMGGSSRPPMGSSRPMGGASRPGGGMTRGGGIGGSFGGSRPSGGSFGGSRPSGGFGGGRSGGGGSTRGGGTGGSFR